MNLRLREPLHLTISILGIEGQSLDRAHSLLMILYFLRHLSLLCVTDVDRQTVAFPAFSRVTDTTGRVTYIVNIALLYTLANYCYKYVYFKRF